MPFVCVLDDRKQSDGPKAFVVVCKNWQSSIDHSNLGLPNMLDMAGLGCCTYIYTHINMFWLIYLSSGEKYSLLAIL